MRCPLPSVCPRATGLIGTANRDGRFHLWLSWACGPETNARDAAYLLDGDGDLATREDQVEIARVNQQRFADGTEDGAIPIGCRAGTLLALHRLSGR